jgi:PAS domain S-box-containing protein
MRIRNPALRRVASIAAWAAVYYLVARLSLLFVPRMDDAYAAWLPAGLGVAIVVAYGNPAILGIFAAALALRMQILAGSTALVLGLGLAAMRAFEVWACAVALRRIARSGSPMSAGEVSLASASIVVVVLVYSLACAAAVSLAGPGGGDFRALLHTVMMRVFGDSAGIFILSPPLIIGFGRARRGPGMDRLLWPVASLILGLSFSLFFMLSYAADKREAEQFRSDAREMAETVEDENIKTFEAVRALRAFYSSSEDVGPDEFDTFVAQLLGGDMTLAALSWNPLVKRSERKAYERMLQGRGERNATITETGPKGELVPAGDREEYFPSTLLGPKSSSNAGPGFDYASSPPRLEAISRARDSGLSAITGPLDFAYDSENRVGFLIVEPVYRRGAVISGLEDRRSALQGVVVGSCLVGDWIEHALSRLESHNIDLYLYDVTIPADPLFLAYRPALVDVRVSNSEKSPSINSLSGRLRTSIPLKVGGRDWLLVFLPGSALGEAGPRAYPWLALIIGLSLAGGLLLFVSRMRKADEAVALYARKLEATLDALPHLLFEVDDEGAIVEYRAPAGELPESVSKRFIGRKLADIMPPAAASVLEEAFEEAGREGHSFGSTYALPIPGGTRWYEVSVSAKREPGKQRPHFVVMAQDVTERKRAESLQDALYDIAMASRTAASLDELYAEIHRRIAGAMSARDFFIALRDGAADELRFVYVSDERDGSSAGDLVSPGDGLAERVLRTSASLLYRPGRDDYAYRGSLGSPPKVWLGVPLVVDDKTIGVMGLQDYDDEEAYTSRERRMLEFVSSQVAAAINLRRTEEEVRLVEARNAAIIENASDGIALLDAEGLIAFGSPSAFRAFGYVGDECLGRSAMHWIHPDDAKRVGGKFRELVADPGKRFVEEHRFRCKDGSYRWVRSAFTNLLSHEAVRAVVDNFHDITERVETTEAMVRIKAGLEMSQAVARLGSWELEPGSGAMVWSGEMFELLRRDPGLGPLSVAEFMELVHPEDREALLRAERETESRGTRAEIEFRFVRSRDETQYFKTIVVPVKDAGGRTVGLHGVMLDISATKKAQLELEALNRTLEHRVAERTAELSRSEATYRALFDDSHEGILLLTRNAEAIAVNRSLITLFGYTLEEYKALGPYAFRAFVKSKTDEASSPRFAALLGGEELPPFEDEATAKDGRTVAIEVVMSAIRDVDGTISTVQLMIRDISARKKAEAALRESRDRMAEANAALERASRIKDEFFANMSHEIRTPMNAIIGLSSLALKTEMTEKQRDYIEKVRDSGVSLLGIINDILDFSKLEAGKMSIEKIDFDLEELIGNLGAMVSQKIQEKGLEFLVHVASDVPGSWSGDPLRLGQVLLNLVSNAVKFTERGEIELSVSLDGESGELLFEVRDTGIGIEPKVAGSLFQAFTQADSSTTRKYGGTGLGLSICRRIVELMGGRIWVESESGRGSVFSFTVLLDPRPDEAKRGVRLPADLAGLRALVVDDNAAARSVEKDIMTELGCRTEAVESGEAALEILAREDAVDRFGLVLMDLYMPGMNGIEATGRIKKTLGLSEAPIVFVTTGSAGDELRPSAVEAGADDYILKPLTTGIIAAALRRRFAPQAVEGRRAPSREADRRELAGARVLLVEDNEINRQIAVELLQSKGMDVSIAVDGNEAVEAVLKSGANFDIVLMDIQMPVMDGYEAARRIRADARFASLPIVAMTAYAADRDMLRILEAGMNDRVSKPFEPEALFDALSKYLSGRVPPEASPSEAAAEAAPVDGDQAVVVPELAQFDVDEGMTRVAGNLGLYVSLLRKFASGNRDAADRISEALVAGDASSAERIAHTLKGVGGNIGAKAVREDAAALESAIRDGESPERVRGALESLRSSLKRAVSEIDEKVSEPEEAPDEPPSTVDPGLLSEIIEGLLRLTRDYDTEAAELLHSSRRELLSGFGSEPLKELEKALSSYDYPAATRWLEVHRPIEGDAATR